MPSCVLRYCTNSSTNTAKCKGITFHRFPRPGRKDREKWIKFVQNNRSEEFWLPSDNSSYVCSVHFREEDKYNTVAGRCFLRKNAVPCIDASSKTRFQPRRQPQASTSVTSAGTSQSKVAATSAKKRRKNSSSSRGSDSEEQEASSDGVQRPEKKKVLPQVRKKVVRDQAAIFGEYVASRVRRMAPQLASKVQNRIQHLIYLAETQGDLPPLIEDDVGTIATRKDETRMTVPPAEPSGVTKVRPSKSSATSATITIAGRSVVSMHSEDGFAGSPGVSMTSAGRSPGVAKLSAGNSGVTVPVVGRSVVSLPPGSSGVTTPLVRTSVVPMLSSGRSFVTMLHAAKSVDEEPPDDKSLVPLLPTERTDLTIPTAGRTDESIPPDWRPGVPMPSNEEPYIMVVTHSTPQLDKPPDVCTDPIKLEPIDEYNYVLNE